MSRVMYEAHGIPVEQIADKYIKPALAWLEATDSKMRIAFVRTGPYFPDDKDDRDIYHVVLKRGLLSYTFAFGQSIANSRQSHRLQPNAYSILACLEVNNPESFEDFCRDCGFDTDSRKTERIYQSVASQYLQLSRMYSSAELEALADKVQ